MVGPRLRESGGGQEGRGGGISVNEDGSMEESGWSAMMMAGRAVARLGEGEESEEEEEVESTEEEQERTEEEEEEEKGEVVGPCGGSTTTPLELGVGPPAV